MIKLRSHWFRSASSAFRIYLRPAGGWPAGWAGPKSLGPRLGWPRPILIRRFAPCFILKGEKQDVEDETPLVWRDRVSVGSGYSIPSSSPATAHNQEFWAQAKTRCKLGTYQISYILSSTILVPSRNKCVESIHCHILTSLWLLSKCKMCRKYSWHSPKL